MALSLSLLVEYASDIAFEKFAVHGLGHVPDERGSLFDSTKTLSTGISQAQWLLEVKKGGC
jgi:hypothetical protein